MKTTREMVNSILSEFAKNMVGGEPREWPPECNFLLYQPERPAAEDSTEE